MFFFNLIYFIYNYKIRFCLRKLQNYVDLRVIVFIACHHHTSASISDQRLVFAIK